MLLNKALILSANNWKVMVKALIFQVLILALLVALCFLIFGGIVNDIISVSTAGGWDDFFRDTVQSIADGTFDGTTFAQQLAQSIDKTQAAIEAIPNMWNRVEFSYITCIILVILYRMLISFSDVAVSFQIAEFMTSNTERPFTWFVVKKFGESCSFIFRQMLLALPLDLLVVIGSTGLSLIFVLTLRWWSIIPAAIIALFMYSARHAYLAFWLPSLVTEGKNVRQSCINGLTVIPRRFWHVFWKTFVVILLMACISLVSLLYIDNALLKLAVGTVPNLCLFFILKCINLVEYFQTTNKPYFYKKVYVEGTDQFNKKMAREKRSSKSAKTTKNK